MSQWLVLKANFFRRPRWRAPLIDHNTTLCKLSLDLSNARKDLPCKQMKNSIVLFITLLKKYNFKIRSHCIYVSLLQKFESQWHNFFSTDLLVLEIFQNLFESCHLQSGGCHQLKRITNRTSQPLPQIWPLASSPEFPGHESDIRAELRDLRGPPRPRPDWSSYLRLLTNSRAWTRSLNLRQSLGDSVQEAA